MILEPDPCGCPYLGTPKPCPFCDCGRRDSDASLAEDPKGLSGEAVAARAEGIAHD